MTLLCALASVLWLNEKNKKNVRQSIIIFGATEILTAESPSSELLHTCIGKIVIVKLRGGKSIRGRLHDFDQYMNLVIQDAVELLNKNDHGSIGANNRLSTVLLRADNILIIAIESSI
jgi:small nuclear ribonucleoprotein